MNATVIPMNKTDVVKSSLLELGDSPTLTLIYTLTFIAEQNN
jgi:hypothetical protein